jgi:hypothetical protein
MGGADNAGSITVSAGDSHIFGDIDNTGEIVVTGGGTATFYNNVEQNGVLRVSKAGDVTSVAVFLGLVTGAGGSTGDGDIFFEGGPQPGNSAALVNYQSNVHFGSGSILHIELGGTTAGSEHDHIVASGNLSLDGALDVSFIEGFVPDAGQSFEILSAAAANGTFASATLPVLPGALAWNINYTPTSVWLEVLAPTASAADFDADGDVDGGDFLAWQRGLGISSGAQRGQGDANGDGAVTAADLAAWRAGFPAALARAAVGAVPEPDACVLLVAAGLAIVFASRCRALLLQPS